MHGPALVGWLLVALCGGTGLYCLLGAVRGVHGAARRRSSAAEGVMGVGMAVMAAPAPLPPGLVAVALAVVFGAAALWSLISRAALPHRGHHALESSAMVYMALAMRGGAHGAGGHDADGAALHGELPAAGVPVLTGVLLLYFAGYAMYVAWQLLPAAPAVSAGRAQAQVATGCRLSLALAMAAMLPLM
ncbi:MULTISPECIES: DUF5134 domain-containing protein [unclassified Streptomyces]|uniref:DUF5134 domain-containing protein n=1 Tax=unclassified Streptomyces TaxID=2593676 RepID=UPI000CD51331|nr:MULTISPECIES: DUF5134 domain-containing protein [unclassified Streptomyces]